MKFAIAAVLAASVAADWNLGHGLGRRVDYGYGGVDARYARSQIKGRGGLTYASGAYGQSRRGGYGARGYGKGYGGYGGYGMGSGISGKNLRDAQYSHGGYVQSIGHRDGRSYTTNWSSAGYGSGKGHGYGHEPYAHGSETVIVRDQRRSSPASTRGKQRVTKYGYKKSGTLDFKGLNGLGGLSGLSGLNGTGVSLSGLSGVKGLQGMNGLSGLNNRLGGIRKLGGVQGLSGVKGLDGLNNNLGMAGLNGVKGLGGLSGLGGIRGVSGDIGLGAGKVGVDQSQGLLGQQRLGGRFGVNYGGNVGYNAGTVGYAPQ